MIVDINQQDIPKINKKEIKVGKSHNILKATIFFIVLIIALSALLFHRYFSLISSVSSITGQNIAQKASSTIPTPEIKYNNQGGKYINILAMGSDNDGKGGNNLAPLTQTMIIVSINTQNNSVNIISIPRDSWVNIPGYGMGKIDEASDKLDGTAGLELAIQTVEADYNIKINHYAWVGLSGFIKIVDLLGGVNLDVQQPILDELYPMDLSPSTTDPNSLNAAERIDIPAGPQHLDGTQALDYVRSRHGNAEGDFARSARQQQLILALRKQVNVDTLISQLPNMLSSLSGSTKTDLTVTDIIGLLNIERNISTNNIHQYVLQSPDYGSNTVSSTGQDIVAPNFTKIDALFNQLFN
jgi:LCP family protein required for cell wall assembly